MAESVNLSDSLHPPDLSVVIVTPTHYAAIRKTMQHLRAQTVSDRLEIVIVAPAKDRLKLDESALGDFQSVRVIEVGEIRKKASAIAAGVQQATAPVVAFAEDHSYPASDWAEALIKAHQQPWAAVGPVMTNANPNGMISWTNFLMDYGRWGESTVGGVTDEVPGHNSSYKRKILIDYGPELEAILETESVLHQDLRNKGYQLYLEPAAKASHINVSRFSSFISLRFNFGQVLAASRVQNEGWSLFRRLLYTGGGALIPLMYLRPMLERLGRCNQRKLLPRILPALIVGIIAHSIGEMAGYAFGVGDAGQRMLNFELHRHRHLTEQDSQSEIQ